MTWQGNEDRAVKKNEQTEILFMFLISFHSSGNIQISWLTTTVNSLESTRMVLY
jgi:hypothetical protein